MSAAPLPDRQIALLAGAALVIGALAVWPWLPSGGTPRRPVETIAAAAPGGVLAALPPLAHFAGTVERPLFSPSRRPEATAAAPAAAAAALQTRYHVLGLFASGDRRRALLADGKRTIVIAEGAALDGWTIKRIEQDRLVLSSATGEAVLVLNPAGTETGADETPPATASAAALAAALPAAALKPRP